MISYYKLSNIHGLVRQYKITSWESKLRSYKRLEENNVRKKMLKPIRTDKYQLSALFRGNEKKSDHPNSKKNGKFLIKFYNKYDVYIFMC